MDCGKSDMPLGACCPNYWTVLSKSSSITIVGLTGRRPDRRLHERFALPMRISRNARAGFECAHGQYAKRLSITEAAEEIFAREGYAAASIDSIASRAGVSRQTVYNHYGDKANLFVAVVRDLAERSNAGLFQTIASFPREPTDLAADLADFAYRLMRNCICNPDGKALRRLIEAEGERHPELFDSWRTEGPDRAFELLGARFAALDDAGSLTIENPVLAARQFVALANADIQMTTLFGGRPSEAELRSAAANATRTFLAAFGRRTRSPATADRGVALADG